MSLDQEGMSGEEFAEQTKPNGAVRMPIRSLYWTLDDIKNLDPPEWIIEGILPRRGKALTFGESGHYKTLHVVDQLCRTAHDMDYHGLTIKDSYPACFLANEDAYGLAVQRIQGWHLHYGKPSGRVIILPSNTKLDQPEDVERAIACARDAFGNERPIFAIDTWDRSISGNPNSTEDVNPALNGLDVLLEAGEATVTISHSPWSDKNRTKGAVTFWGNHDTRIKAEKDETTGRGILKVMHQKNARPGLEIAFHLEEFEFEHRGVATDTLIPQRDLNHQPERTSQDEGRGSRQKTMMRLLKKDYAKHPDGVARGNLKSAFILEINTEREKSRKPAKSADHARNAFNQTFGPLRDRGLIEGPDDALRPSE